MRRCEGTNARMLLAGTATSRGREHRISCNDRTLSPRAKPARRLLHLVGMVATTFEELEVWQLADALRRHVIDITESGPAAADFRFKGQIRDAADSICENIAEGFGRYDHGEFAQFLDIAFASLKEVESKLTGGVHRRYFSQNQRESGLQQARRIHAAMTSLMRFLRSSKAPKPFSRKQGTARPQGGGRT